MKLMKLSVLAIAMGLFVASCGNGDSGTPPADTTAPPPAMPPSTPPPADTGMKPVDTMGGTTADATKTEPKMEEKKK